MEPAHPIVALLEEALTRLERQRELLPEQARAITVKCMTIIMAAIATAPAPVSATPEPHTDDLLTVEQAAGLLQLTPDNVYKLVRTRQLRAVRIGKYYRIRRATLERFVVNHERAEIGQLIDQRSIINHDRQAAKGNSRQARPHASGARPRIGRGCDDHKPLRARAKGDSDRDGEIPDDAAGTTTETQEEVSD